MIRKVCEKCNKIHVSDIAIAINRFDTNNNKYKGNFNNSSIRGSRQEAEKDWCGYFQNRNNH